jgi:hypothetical protein
VLCLRVKAIGAGARLDVKKDGKGPRFFLTCVLEEQPAAETYDKEGMVQPGTEWH